MIRWGESRRRQDPGFFCRLATRGAEQPLWVGVAWPVAVEARAFYAEALSDLNECTSDWLLQLTVVRSLTVVHSLTANRRLEA